MRNTIFAIAITFASIHSLGLALAQDPKRPPETQAEVDEALIPYKAKREAKGTLRVGGPIDCKIFVDAWIKELQKIHPEFKVTYESAPPPQAAEQLREGKQQIVLMSRTMRAVEVEAFQKVHGARPLPINVGLGALAVIVHPSNPLPSVSFEQLDAMYAATPRRGAPRTARTWGEIGLKGEKGEWADRKILPAIRSPGAGANEAVEETILVKSKFADHVQFMDPGTKVVDFVAGEPQAIGFVTTWLGVGKPNVRAVPVVSVDGEPTAPTLEAILDGRYPVRPLVCYVKYAKGDPIPPAEVVEFLRYAQSREGQVILLRSGGIPMTHGMVEANLELYDDLGIPKD
jgi:phosphate transport system substrate-binding protein